MFTAPTVEDVSPKTNLHANDAAASSSVKAALPPPACLRHVYIRMQASLGRASASRRVQNGYKHPQILNHPPIYETPALDTQRHNSGAVLPARHSAHKTGIKGTLSVRNDKALIISADMNERIALHIFLLAETSAHRGLV